jgi:probable HAF family extracellular repeat protein
MLKAPIVVQLVLLLLTEYSPGAEVTFTPLGDLPAGPRDSIAFGISADGGIVSGSGVDFQGKTRAVRWSSSIGMINLGKLPGGADVSTAGSGRSISGDGAVVVGYSGSANAQTEAFRWTSETGMVGLGTLEPLYSTVAWSVSGDGSTVVGYADSSADPQAFRWTANEGMQRLSGMTADSSGASAASWDGSVIVGQSLANGKKEAFRWTSEEGPIGLGFLSAADFDSDPKDITPDGSVIVGTSTSYNGTRSFHWTEADGMIDIGNLGTRDTYAMAVSGNGTAIVGTADGTQAFLWTKDGGMADLQSLLTHLGIDLTGWRLRQARSISADGTTITGFGDGPRGREAWVATIPEPSTSVLAALAILLITISRSVNQTIPRLVIALWTQGSAPLRPKRNAISSLSAGARARRKPRMRSGT